MEEKEPRKKEEGAPRKEPPSKECKKDYIRRGREDDPYKEMIFNPNYYPMNDR